MKDQDKSILVDYLKMLTEKCKEKMSELGFTSITHESSFSLYRHVVDFTRHEMRADRIQVINQYKLILKLKKKRAGSKFALDIYDETIDDLNVSEAYVSTFLFENYSHEFKSDVFEVKYRNELNNVGDPRCDDKIIKLFDDLNDRSKWTIL